MSIPDHAFPRPTRRDLLIGMAATLPLLLPMGRAAAAPLRSFKHGRFGIEVFSDGFLMLSQDILLPDADFAERKRMLARLHGRGTAAPVAANVTLVQTENDLILIDTGAGRMFQASTGRLSKNLAASGVDAQAITKVVFTHVHPDHSGGTIGPDGLLQFPNADYYVAQSEWDFWNDPNFEAHHPIALHDFALGARRDLHAVKDRITRVLPGDEIVPGMLMIATPGHTPGHASIQLEGPETMIIVGDACTSDIIFFENPDWHFGFDTDAELALRTRKQLLDRAASEHLLLLGYHWRQPVGRVERNGSAFRFIPT